MLSLVENYLEITPTISSVQPLNSIPLISCFKFFDHERSEFRNNYQGERRPFVMETVKADDNAKLGMYDTLFLIISRVFLALEL